MSETKRNEYASEANGVLSNLLASFNSRDVQAHAALIERVKDALNCDDLSVIALQFGGSVAKHTYVDGLSDVDMLVQLEHSEHLDQTPEEVKEIFEGQLSEKFGSANVSVGKLAITVRFDDSELQLLPAIRRGDSIVIADATGGEWSRIDPKRFTQILTRVNGENAGKVVPVVKLAKAIVGELPERQRISGYHAESLAVKVFRDYDGPKTLKDMLRHYFEASKDAVLSPIRDRTGQSVHVDEYLGRERSLERRVVSDAFDRIARRMAAADSSVDASVWGGLFGG
ncbi:MAG: nucleotidyltransferase [Gemmatimonadaceae bacterium]|nr:nucleotidyltransferase [Gemmatimonadaceae bacterium]